MLDWERIDDLRAEIGEDDFAEVAEIFLDELEEVVGQLRSGGSLKDTVERLHFLKGCALNLGFATMAQLASDKHDLAIREGPAADLDMSALFDAHTASRAEFAAKYDGLAAA